MHSSRFPNRNIPADTLGKEETTPRFKGELALTAIDNDLFSRSSPLWSGPPLRYFLDAMDEFVVPQRPACVRALANVLERIIKEPLAMSSPRTLQASLIPFKALQVGTREG